MRATSKPSFLNASIAFLPVNVGKLGIHYNPFFHGSVRYRFKIIRPGNRLARLCIDGYRCPESIFYAIERLLFCFPFTDNPRKIRHIGIITGSFIGTQVGATLIVFFIFNVTFDRNIRFLE